MSINLGATGSLSVMIRERFGVCLRAQQGRLARLFPVQECALCGGASHGQRSCAFCRRALPRVPARPVLDALARSLRLDALAVRSSYAFPVDALVTDYKYGARLALADLLAELMPRPPGPARTLLAVPPDPVRLRERGFDANVLLARRYARRHGLRLLHASRTRVAVAQAGLSRRARRDNLRDAFACPALPEAVLILDDVLTSGGTLAALAQACRTVGASWVGAVVLAWTPPPGQLMQC